MTMTGKGERGAESLHNELGPRRQGKEEVRGGRGGVEEETADKRLHRR